MSNSGGPPILFRRMSVGLPAGPSEPSQVALVVVAPSWDPLPRNLDPLMTLACLLAGGSGSHNLTRVMQLSVLFRDRRLGHTSSQGLAADPATARTQILGTAITMAKRKRQRAHRETSSE